VEEGLSENGMLRLTGASVGVSAGHTHVIVKSNHPYHMPSSVSPWYSSPKALT